MKTPWHASLSHPSLKRSSLLPAWIPVAGCHTLCLHCGLCLFILYYIIYRFTLRRSRTSLQCTLGLSSNTIVQWWRSHLVILSLSSKQDGNTRAPVYIWNQDVDICGKAGTTAFTTYIIAMLLTALPVRLRQPWQHEVLPSGYKKCSQVAIPFRTVAVICCLSDRVLFSFSHISCLSQGKNYCSVCVSRLHDFQLCRNCEGACQSDSHGATVSLPLGQYLQNIKAVNVDMM